MKLFDPPRLTGKYLKRVLAAKWLTTGPMNERLREAVGAWVGWPARYIVLASSATAGFQAVLDLLANKGRRTVAIRESTWPGMLAAIKHARLERGHTRRAITVLTDIGGARYDEDWELSPIRIHDACHSWIPAPGARFGVVSFYPTKLVAGAEGGAVFCQNDTDTENLVRRLNCGLEPVYNSGCNRNLSPSLEGRKGNMTDVAAALNLEALEQAPAYIATLQDSHRVLAETAKTLDISYRQQWRQAYLFQIHCRPDRVPSIRNSLAAKGVPTAWNFPPAGLITLPMVPGMKRATANRMLEIVRKALND